MEPLFQHARIPSASMAVSRLEFLQEEVEHVREHVPMRVASLAQAMRAVRIRQQSVVFVVSHQCVQQGLAVLIVAVVIGSAIDQHQVALQTLDVCDCRSKRVPVRVLLDQPHVPFLIDGVVVFLVRYESDSHATLEHIPMPEQAMKCGRPPSTPAPDAHVLVGDEGVAVLQGLDTLADVVRTLDADLFVDALAELSSSRCWRSPWVYGGHDEAILG
mmetsp:Transcript_11900/g.23423  ORF Transcript_11900/g.23423 Transcript_11900/m.23423 type:complete len:216 (+) Transcript_11900:287-934(+)